MTYGAVYHTRLPALRLLWEHAILAMSRLAQQHI